MSLDEFQRLLAVRGVLESLTPRTYHGLIIRTFVRGDSHLIMSTARHMEFPYSLSVTGCTRNATYLWDEAVQAVNHVSRKKDDIVLGIEVEKDVITNKGRCLFHGVAFRDPIVNELAGDAWSDVRLLPILRDYIGEKWPTTVDMVASLDGVEMYGNHSSWMLKYKNNYLSFGTKDGRQYFFYADHFRYEVDEVNLRYWIGRFLLEARNA